MNATLRTLDERLKATQGNLQAQAKAIVSVVASQRVAAAGSKELANAKVAEARAAGITLQANAKAAESAAKAALADEQRAAVSQRVAVANERKAASDDRAAAAARRAADSTLALNDSLSNSRYLLYDVGATYAVLSAGLLAIPVATTAVATAYQKDFAQVIRTTQDTEGITVGLRNELKDLATDIPLAFGDLSGIASMGGQLGVAEDQLASFTETTAKFVATTDVTQEAAGALFGRLSNTFGMAENDEFFNRIGSAIAYVGTNSVATESEIAALLNQIAPLGKNAGMTAEQTVGLAGALASLRVRPELARGTLTRIFADLNRAVDEGGPALEGYARVLGITGDQAAKLWDDKPAEFFQQFVKGLTDARAASEKGGPSLTSIFDSLGLKATRDVDMLTKLSVGYDVLSKSMTDADQAYQGNTALDDMAKPIFETVAAKITTLASAVKNLGDSLGQGTLAPLSMFLDLLQGTVEVITNAVDTVPGLGALLNVLMLFGAVTGVFLGLKAAQAFVLAGLVGFQQVAGKAGIANAMSLTGILRQLATTFLMVGGASQQAAARLVATNGVMGATAMAAGRLTAANTAAAASMGGRVVGGAKALGSSLMSLTGGPIAALVLAMGGLMFAMGGVVKEAEATKEAVAAAFNESDAAGAKALAEALAKKPEGIATDFANNFATNGKSVKDIAEDIGIGFSTLTDAAMGSKPAIDEVRGAIDAFAQSKGYKDYQELKNASEGVKFFDPDTIGAVSAVTQIEDALEGYKAKADETKQSSSEVDAVLDELGMGSNADEALGEAGDAASKAAEDFDELIDGLQRTMDQIFGFVNSEAALNDALAKIGENLQKTGSYNVGSAGGRENIAAAQDAMLAAQERFAALQEAGQMSAAEAAAGYAAFIDGLITEIRDKGGDPTPIVDLANQTKAAFASQIGAGPAATLGVEVSDSDVSSAQAELDSIAQQYGTIDAKVLVSEHGAAEAAGRVGQLQGVIEAATGQPYEAVVNADTQAANENTENTVAYIANVLGMPFLAYVDADATPAERALQVFSQWGQTVLAHMANAIIKVRNLLNKNSKIAPVAIPNFAPKAPRASSPARVQPFQRQEAPAQVAAKTPAVSSRIPESGFAALKNGYNDAAAAADKSGEAAKKAGKEAEKAARDAAKAQKEAAQDAAKANKKAMNQHLDGLKANVEALKEAGKEAESYGSKLSTALGKSMDKRYGMQRAEDAYHSSLNAIAKKREDELKSIQDLITKQKELNNARNEDLIEGRKAKVEQGISLKYGEVDRAADYGQQAKTAFDNAAAKQVEIEAAKKEQLTIQAGIGQLAGYTQAAIDNRAALADLEQKMADMVIAYANTGASQQQVEAYARQLSGALADQVVQSNENIAAEAAHQAAIAAAEQAVEDYTAQIQAADEASDAYIDTLGDIPDEVSTTADNNFDAGIQAASDLSDYIDDIPRYVETDYVTNRIFKGGLVANGNMKDGSPKYLVMNPDGTSTGRQLYNRGGSVEPIRGFASGGLVPGTPPANPREDNMLANVDGQGVVGIRSREFIQPQEAVDYYGTDFMEKIRTLQMPRFNMGGSPGGYSAAGAAAALGPLDLSAESLRELGGVISQLQVVLMTESTTIAATTNEGNKILATTGMGH